MIRKGKKRAACGNDWNERRDIGASGGGSCYREGGDKRGSSRLFGGCVVGTTVTENRRCVLFLVF